ELLLDRQKRPRVAHGGFDLDPVANDRRVRGELLDALRRVSRDLLRVEAAERAPIAFTLVEYDRPAEAGLGRFEHEELEVLRVVMDGHAPLAIVVLHHE